MGHVPIDVLTDAADEQITQLEIKTTEKEATDNDANLQFKKKLEV